MPDTSAPPELAVESAPSHGRPWWRDAVFYEIYVRSFADSDGDGVGDLPGITAHLPYVAELGADALWLTPFYPSPMADHGYDVADPRGVEPTFGTLDELDALVAEAHRLGLKVTIDLIPNHSSDQHVWFQEALAAAPGDPARERYLFRDGRGPDGSEPPNNWLSNFGGPAWTRVPDGQWYLHLFAPGQPDLNWRHPDVLDDYDRTLRFWLDRGVDGFRVDVAHGLVKDAALRDNPGVHTWGTGHGDETRHSVDQPEVHDIYRRWRAILDSYDGDRMAVGEVYLADAAKRAAYVRQDELQLAFNFALLWAPWEAAAMRSVVDESRAAMDTVGAPTTWVLSSHDARRHLTRYGGGDVGLRRSRAAALLLLALPGPVYLYQGEELGLPEVDVPEDRVQDPLWQHRRLTRDGCRIPLPWSGARPPYGFSPGSAEPWLPMPEDWAGLTVEAQADDPSSILSLYRAALRHRHADPAFVGDALSWMDGPADLLTFVRTGDAGERLVCAVNFGGEPVAAPPGAVLLASGPLDGDRLPADTAVWVRPAG